MLQNCLEKVICGNFGANKILLNFKKTEYGLTMLVSSENLNLKYSIAMSLR